MVFTRKQGFMGGIMQEIDFSVATMLQNVSSKYLSVIYGI